MMISKIFTCIQIIFIVCIYGIYIQYLMVDNYLYVCEDILRIIIAFFIFTVAGFMTKYDIDKKLEWKMFIPFGIGLIPVILLLL